MLILNELWVLVTRFLGRGNAQRAFTTQKDSSVNYASSNNANTYTSSALTAQVNASYEQSNEDKDPIAGVTKAMPFARECEAPLWKKESNYFKERILLAKKEESWILLNPDDYDLLADVAEGEQEDQDLES
ncbi:hypothetical protein Tco_1398795 [Tanacetum coccineum]